MNDDTAATSDGAAASREPPAAAIGFDDLARAGEALGRAVSRLGGRIVTAESCTAGLIAVALTETGGSSDWFDRGFVTYSNEAKEADLGVARTTLGTFGAVSEAVAAEMAAGALARGGPAASLALAVTGIAGPGGGSPAKPVGTICFGWAIRPPAGTGQDAGPIVEVVTRRFEGSRRAVRFGTAWFALAEGLARWQRALGDRPPTA